MDVNSITIDVIMGKKNKDNNLTNKKMTQTLQLRLREVVNKQGKCLLFWFEREYY